MIEDPKPGKRVEIRLDPDDWLPAVITRGPFRPFRDQPIDYWEVEATDNRGESYVTARTVEDMREP